MESFQRPVIDVLLNPEKGKEVSGLTVAQAEYLFSKKDDDLLPCIQQRGSSKHINCDVRDGMYHPPELGYHASDSCLVAGFVILPVYLHR